MTTNNSGSNYFFDEETRKALQRASEILNKDLEGMMGINSGGNMENDNKTCGSVYEIAGYFVQNNGFVRNCSGEYIGQLSDLEECEARGKEIAKLKEQLSEQKYSSDPSKAMITISAHLAELKAKDELLEKMREIIITISGGVADHMEVYRAKEIVDTACEQALALLPKPLNKTMPEKETKDGE